MSLARPSGGLLVVLCLLVVFSVDGLKAPKSKFVGRIISCLTCPHEGEHHAKQFAKAHTHEYEDLHLEEVHEEDIHQLVVSDRDSGEEVSRHDIKDLRHGVIRNLAIQNGIRIKPSEKHMKKARRMNAEIQHCTSCDDLLSEGGHSARKLSLTYKRMYRGVEVASVANQERNCHDLVIFDATGREVERKDLSKLTPQQTHSLLLKRGFQLHNEGRPHHVTGAGAGAEASSKLATTQGRVGPSSSSDRHRRLHADHLERRSRRLEELEETPVTPAHDAAGGASNRAKAEAALSQLSRLSYSRNTSSKSRNRSFRGGLHHAKKNARSGEYTARFVARNSYRL